MLREIAVPLDGSAVGECALPYAVSLAWLSRATLTLLHVHRPYLPGRSLEALPQYQFQGIVGFDLAADRDAHQREGERLARLAEHLRRSYGVAVTTRVLDGEVRQALAEYTRSSAVDVMVMGTHGHVGPWRTWFESVSDAVVRRSPVPVLLVRADPSAPPPEPQQIDFRRALVPVDGSAFSESMVEHVIDLGRKLSLQVTLLRVVPTPQDEGEDGASAATFSAGSWQPPQDYLDGLSNRFPITMPVPVTRLVRAEFAGPAIVEEVERGAYDMIAMATHGRGGVRHLLLGSTADEVIRGTRLPILLLRPQAPAPAQQGTRAARVPA